MMELGSTNVFKKARVESVMTKKIAVKEPNRSTIITTLTTARALGPNAFSPSFG